MLLWRLRVLSVCNATHLFLRSVECSCRYFGGDLNFYQIYGYGTDMLIKLHRVSEARIVGGTDTFHDDEDEEDAYLNRKFSRGVPVYD